MLNFDFTEEERHALVEHQNWRQLGGGASICGYGEPIVRSRGPIPARHAAPGEPR
jgi:hypothetical protein